ncbi:MAG TPA: hypothetical protein PLA92_00195 [Fimbriimonadaceae bacterium]|nr:hypothetical protein [Fimbriimonadaceae bacterium]
MKQRHIAPTLLWRGLLVTFVIVAVAAFARTMSSYSNHDYDYEASRAKLLAIGRALQLYRAEVEVLPPAQRTKWSDAGLPLTCTILTLPGKTWSLAEGYQSFRVAKPNRGIENGAGAKGTHFQRLYYDPRGYEKLGDISMFFSSRGEKLPSYADTNMNSIEDEVTPGKQLKALILRLNGEVDLVTYTMDERFSLLKR